ncbi:hypothetical protein BK133_25310 [Paenibacillus sp. FSL H8-0548]|uniref:LamG-like jellyroll fold domain-containing protein n=1 Tax=Paenibacillus sp. FSL H8-0548 TaxID=1920422 RepID=UPI00096F1783|nr:LamG-like jellyroll fold domain-containing protein [Paenibacillus sp. FSL H8-0548]OMF22908.1 hypothetical protein BK133_25310 [Paenibacillus sp. FSL H8-0548]
MKSMNSFYSKRFMRKMMSLLLVFALVTGYLPVWTSKVLAEDAIPAASDKVTIIEVEEDGFTHPGVGLTKAVLDNMREQIIAQKKPWYSYYVQMTGSAHASKAFSSSLFASSNPDGTDNPKSNAVGGKEAFVTDGLRAYTQAIMYYITGDEAYRANAMRIIRLWEQMDPSKYTYFVDSHIHMGIPLNRMTTAAEILRYSSSDDADPKWAWTEEDTERFTNNLINPMITTFMFSNGRFMNQHLYSLIGSMSGHIFTNNTEKYAEAVEWFTVNESAVDQWQNGAIKQLFRLVDKNDDTGEAVNPPVVQHVEMGRDQAHGAGDITNVEILSRLLDAQGTKVDPEEGTISTADDAVNIYNFLDDRILKAADYFAQFMLGYDTPWIPVKARINEFGDEIIYKELSGAYRGRIGGNVYGQYYYYKYNLGMDISEVAPYYTAMFNMRLPYYWESPDGGADYWMFIPAEAAEEGTSTLPKVSANPNINDIELRFSSLDAHSAIKQEGDISYVEITATEGGSRGAIIASSTAAKTVGLKVRTNGTAKLEINGWSDSAVVLPDTNGEWKYVIFTMSDYQGLGDVIYFNVTGSGTTVDIDHLHLTADIQFTPPVFKSGKTTLRLFGYVGSQATLQYDFSATDAGQGDTVTYKMDNKPEGAQFDEDTGEFSWQPQQTGTYPIVVSATDGTSVTARNVSITVGNNREAAVEGAIASYDQETSYISASLDIYNSRYTDVLDSLSSASDDEFYQKLIHLNEAVQGLQLLTPLMQDGSMNYLDMVSFSTFGTQLANLMDGKPDSFAGYYLAENLGYTMDFGTGFRVSADAFELQVRASFPERISGVTFFGSNDKENWSRLTPGLTEMNEDMQRLEVAEEFRDQQFRFIKVQMIDRVGGSVGIELSELRIFGERHELINKLELVSITSPQNVLKRIVMGNNIELKFKTSESIQDVRVQIQNLDVEATTSDNINWTAQMIAGSNVEPGKLKFSINYKTAGGLDGAETIFTTDDSFLILADETELLDDILEIADLKDSSLRNPTDLLNHAKMLFDGDPDSLTDFRVGGNGAGGFITFDFKLGGQARLSKVEILARQDNNFGRVNGVVVQGSNDNTTWTNISQPAIGIRDWQTLMITSNEPYRYIRIFNGNNWFGNMSELRLHGKVTVSIDVLIADADSIASDQFTKGSYYLFSQEVSRIKAQLEKPERDEELLIYDIKKANSLLVSYTGGVDKTLLELFVDKAVAAQNVGIYSSESLQLLQTAVESADLIVENADASQEDVDEASDSMQDALESLEYMPGMPVLEGLEDLTVNAEQSVVFTVEAVNAAEVVYGVIGDLPAGASFNAQTGAFTWTPAREQGGTHDITFSAAVGELSSSRTITITVKGQPALNPVGPVERTTRARELLTYEVSATDPTGGTLVYSAAGLPFGAKLDAKTGVFTWTPAQTDYGIHQVTFTVSNTKFSVSQTLILNVELHIFASADFTKGSYYLYEEKAERIESEIGQPGANKQQLLTELEQAEGLLVRKPLSLYSLDGNLDNTFGSTAGVAFGSPSYVEGKTSQAIQLNGSNQYVQLPASHALANYDEITLATWVYWDLNGQWQRIFDFGNGTNQYLFLTPRSGDNTLRFAIKNGGAEQFVQTSQLVTNQWVHVAVTLGNNNAKLFVNGEEKASAGMTIKPRDFKPSLNYIGKSQFADPLFSGKLDEFVIYNRALSTEEIGELYNGNVKWRDDSLLELLLTDAADHDLEWYTEDSWAALQVAIAEAQQLLESAGSTQQQIDEASDSMQQALEQLALIPSIVGLDTVEVVTVVGIPPELPSMVNAVYNTEAVVSVQVVWNSIDPVLYSTPGSFSITGVVDGTLLPVIAHVTVLDPDASLPPTNLYASDITADSMVLNWTASGGNVAVIGYDILTDGQLSGTVTGSTYNYNLSDLEPNTSYTFKVVAVDEAGNRTPSAEYTTKTLSSLDQVPPTAPTGLTAGTITANSLVLGWTASIDDVGVVRYDVYQGDNKAGSVTGSTYSYSVTGLAASTSYTFKVIAFDAAENHSASEPYTVMTASAPQQDSGIGSTAPPISRQEEPIVEGNQIKVKPVVKEGAAQAVLSSESLNKAIANAMQSKEQTLLIILKSEEQASSIKVELPSDAWLKAKQEGIKSIVIESGLVSFTIAIDAITVLPDQAKLTLTIEAVDISELPASLSEALKDKPVYDFSLSIDGQSTGAFKGDKAVEVRIPYLPNVDEQISSLVAAYINDLGHLEIVRNSKFDAKAGVLVFYAKHFSKYAIVANPVVFTDTDSYSWAQKSINALATRQIIVGTGDGQFSPERAVTRAEFLKMLMEAYDLVQPGHTATYNDVKSGQWYSDAVATAQAIGIVSGYEDGSFGLNRAITREEMAVIAVRVLTAAGIELEKTREAVLFKDANQIADYAAAAVRILGEAGFIEGKGANSFAPKAQTIRAEAATLIANMLGLN